ncbi:metal-dependent hydrolase [Cohnella faecalis]|uniref:Metal-dependent hydrolase n=1 Tax=Cohnella faecalis TaxID=2315694 RepID=A0A398CLB2_9BACL|nr:metal-dependent hydrolase [Cohnella faecalis]RIE03453.1 metal-dependent hydrolase [Cohnella faecalis]
MKGSTHLAIGAAVGAAASLYYPFSFHSAALYVTAASVSALSADLDGPSLLSNKLKLGKLAEALREFVIWAGVLLMGIVAYRYYSDLRFDKTFAASGIALFLIGIATKEGVIRNLLVSVIGGGFLYAGFTSGQPWLMGFGLFVAWAPWLKHRGMTHTVWALLLWALIGRGLERQLGLDGIMAASAAGYASHLLADTLTPQGVKWLYPIYKKSIKFPLS